MTGSAVSSPYTLGYFIGMVIATMIFVFICIFIYSKGNFGLAWARFKTKRTLALIALFTVLPTLIRVGQGG